jgi:preprotein translocase subunit SecG
MGIGSIILLVIFVIAALVMILVIMLQDDQGEGIGGLFGGGSSTAFGSRSGNILTRFTSILGAIFIVGAFALAWLNRTPETTDIVEKARLERVQEAEQADWWVERIEEAPVEQVEPEQSASGAQEAEEGAESELPAGINR